METVLLLVCLRGADVLHIACADTQVPRVSNRHNTCCCLNACAAHACGMQLVSVATQPSTALLSAVLQPAGCSLSAYAQQHIPCTMLVLLKNLMGLTHATRGCVWLCC